LQTEKDIGLILCIVHRAPSRHQNIACHAHS